MILSVSSWLWTLPIVFMIHEFEEIIMFRPWYDKYGANLENDFPKLRRIFKNAKASTPALALGISEEFIVISGITLYCVEYQLFSLWIGVLLGFAIHLLPHIGSFFIKKGYVPSIITSIVGMAYTILALVDLHKTIQFNIPEIIIWVIVAIIVLIVNLMIITKLIEVFDRWLTNWSRPISES